MTVLDLKGELWGQIAPLWRQSERHLAEAQRGKTYAPGREAGSVPLCSGRRPAPGHSVSLAVLHNALRASPGEEPVPCTGNAG